MIALSARSLLGHSSGKLEGLILSSSSSLPKLGFLNLPESSVSLGFDSAPTKKKSLGLASVNLRSEVLRPIKVIDGSKMAYGIVDFAGSRAESESDLDEEFANDSSGVSGKSHHMVSTIGKSTNIMWHGCSVGKLERQKLLQQKGCVIWITGLSGSGKSTMACALSRALHYRGKLTYVLDGDNVRHGLNRDLSFKSEDRAENVRRIGEVAKLFADAGMICIASLISPYRRDRDACRALLLDGAFIEVFMDVPLQVCEARDPKGLYKLARAGKIRGFTGIDDPYEPPLNCEIVLQQNGACDSPCDMAEKVVSYLEEKGYLHA